MDFRAAVAQSHSRPAETTMLYDNKKSGFRPKSQDDKTPKEKPRELKGLSFEEGESKTRPKELKERPKVDKELLKKKTKAPESSPKSSQGGEKGGEKEGEKAKVKSEKGGLEKEQPEKKNELEQGEKKLDEQKDDKSVSKVVEKAESMEGQLKHRQNAGGASDALEEGFEGDPTMNCWDAVLYIANQAGVLKADVLKETESKSKEGYKGFIENELPGIRDEENKLNKEFSKLNEQIDDAKKEIVDLQKDVKDLKTTFSKYFLWTPKARAKRIAVINKRIEVLGDRIESLRRDADKNMKERKVWSDKRMKGELEARNRPYKDLLKVDQAVVIMTTTRKGKNGEPEVTTVEGQWPPPAGYTILLTHDNSKCEDLDHVMLSLGGGKAAHLQSVTPTELGLKGFDAGKLKSIDLLEYMKTAAGTSDTWTVKAAPPCWK